MYRTSAMFDDPSPVTLFVKGKIAKVNGVSEVRLGEMNVLEVLLTDGTDKILKEDVIDIGRRAMVPVHVISKNEWADDYYTKIKVPGFAGEPVEAPPEEVAAEPKGALKLLRIRSKTRGRPVVAWRHGDQELRQGTRIKFSKESCLQWTAGRTMTVEPGATAQVVELSPRRPIAFIEVGDYDQVELPVHMLGHYFDVDGSDKDEASDKKPRSTLPASMKHTVDRLIYGGGSTDWDNTQGEFNPDDKAIMTGEDVDIEEVADLDTI